MRNRKYGLGSFPYVLNTSDDCEFEVEKSPLRDLI